MDTWLKVQSAWLYLEPVFSSEEILNQMPVEGGIFKDGDSQWRQMMINVDMNTKATVIMENMQMGDILKECFTSSRACRRASTAIWSPRGGYSLASISCPMASCSKSCPRPRSL